MTLGCLALAACVPACLAPRLRFNLSPCLPRGVYYLAYGEPLGPGELVLACPPASAAELALGRHYLLPGSCPGGTKPVGKLVAALAGDSLELAASGIAVNGEALSSTATLAVDSQARPLPRQPPGLRRVAAGEVWLLSAHPRSFDSRYFGPIAAEGVLGTLTPLITAGGADPAALAGDVRRAHQAIGRAPRSGKVAGDSAGGPPADGEASDRPGRAGAVRGFQEKRINHNSCRGRPPRQERPLPRQI